MSREPEQHDRAETLDEQLSALLDRELAPSEAIALRERIAREPALAERYARFEALGAELRGLPQTPVPADLAVRMRERLRREGTPGAAEPADTAAPDARTPISEAERKGAARPPRTGARRPPAHRTRWLAPASAAAAVAAGLALLLVIARGPGESPTRGTDPGAVLLSEATDEELGIALQYETLTDLEVIEQLDLLEILDELEGGEPG